MSNEGPFVKLLPPSWDPTPSEAWFIDLVFPAGAPDGATALRAANSPPYSIPSAEANACRSLLHYRPRLDICHDVTSTVVCNVNTYLTL